MVPEWKFWKHWIVVIVSSGEIEMLIEFASFLRFRGKGQKRFEYSPCGFENKKNDQVFKNIRVRVDEASYLIWWLFFFFKRINVLKNGFEWFTIRKRIEAFKIVYKTKQVV